MNLESGGLIRPNHSNSSQSKTPIPNFTLPMVDGSQFTLSQYRKKIVVLHFWTSWCPHCRCEIPDLIMLNEATKQRGYVKLVCINMTDGRRETRDKVNSFLSQVGYNLPVAYDENGSLCSQLGISALPTTLVVDTHGNLSGYVLGETSYDKIMSMVKVAR